MSYAPTPTWDLDPLLPGGVAGDEFGRRLDILRKATAVYQANTSGLGPLDRDADAWREAAREHARLLEEVQSLSGVAHCTLSAHSRSTAARLASAAVDEAFGDLERAGTPLTHALGDAHPDHLDAFVAHPDLADHGPWLRFLADGTRLELDRPRQELMLELDREALHGWGQLYHMVSGALEGTVEAPGQAPERHSIGAITMMRSDPSPERRQAAFHAGQRAWASVQDLCATALTHITGARQTRFDRLDVDELAPSLQRNRVSLAVVEALWEACDAAQPALLRYMERKARLLGKPRLDWCDLSAPLSGEQGARIGWEDAQELVVGAFERFDPGLRDFAVRALSERWVEAEPREDKAPGAFCAKFAKYGQSRVFMTWADSLDATLTLAHELGHAYHNEVLFTQPFVNQRVTSALAETASTFAEALVRDTAVARAQATELRVFMLDQQLQAGVGFLMNIPARFRFERQLFQLRRRGAFDPDALSQTMVACQRAAYGDALGQWDPLFWASKLHFYISQFGFYNWPYTFGYLFSSAVYTRALSEGPSFAPRYRELLRMTGYERTETIGREMLGEDLTDVAFWQRATAPLMDNVRAFLEATDEG